MDCAKPKDIQKIFREAEGAFQRAVDERALYSLKLKYLGKKGSVSLALKGLKDLPAEDRPLAGRLIQQARKGLESLYEEKQRELSDKALFERIKKESLDLGLPGPPAPLGAAHPASQIIERVVEIFRPLGWVVQSGPLAESDWYNFSALNIPPFHPSRDLQDTFYIGQGDHVLRTHTSPAQIRTLEKRPPPLAVLAPGAVFRRDSDVSHSPMFHQMEGLYVDKKASLADLKGTLAWFLKKLFESSRLELRFRPSFFPFTEPSAEYDISCPFCRQKGCSVCKRSGWIEIGGCGLVHPEVFRSVRLNSETWQGFAFGLGVERLALVLYRIPDIRLFFENDVRFLKQFSAL